MALKEKLSYRFRGEPMGESTAGPEHGAVCAASRSFGQLTIPPLAVPMERRLSALDWSDAAFCGT
jgi:hypothetical protein